MFNSVLDENWKERGKKTIIQGADDKLGFGTRVGLVLTGEICIYFNNTNCSRPSHLALKYDIFVIL